MPRSSQFGTKSKMQLAIRRNSGPVEVPPTRDEAGGSSSVPSAPTPPGSSLSTHTTSAHPFQDVRFLMDNRTPTARIAHLRRELEKNNRPNHRMNMEALIKYYEDGGRCPEDQEELWAINGELSWGIRRLPEDFPGDTFFKSYCFCETFKWHQ